MENLPRRRVLQAAAAGTAASVAGCSALDDEAPTAEEEGEEAPEAADESPDEDPARELDGEAAATVAVDIDEQMEAAQMEIQSQVEEGDLDQEEAQMELQETQQEILQDVTGAVEETVGGIDGIAVAETVPQAGAVLVDGDALGVLELLEDDDVQALLSAAEFDALA
ncbi:hypothetical protein JCM17823_10640 [Halorubrum gandharaense]